MTQSRHIVIHEWMLDLGLRGSELIAYALIWGFCQDGESEFYGSATYVAQWCGVSRQQAVTILRKLTKSGLVDKTDEVGYPCHYRIAFNGGCQETLHPQKLDRGCQETLPLSPHTPLSQNKIDIKIDKHTLSAHIREDKLPFGEFVRLTSDEHDKLVQLFGAADAARLCQILDDYLVDHPRKKYVSHFNVVSRGWPLVRLQEEKLTQLRMRNAQEAAQRANTQKAPETHYADLAEIDARRKAIEDKYKNKTN